MKKTYKTFNGENRNCFFKVGKALVEARFNPTYTTDNEFVQKAIEDSYSFKAGELQLATTALQWLPIDRDENGRITDDCYYAMLDSLDKHPCFVVSADFNYCDYLIVTQLMNINEWYDLVMNNPHYTHYLPIPKLEV